MIFKRNDNLIGKYIFSGILIYFILAMILTLISLKYLILFAIPIILYCFWKGSIISIIIIIIINENFFYIPINIGINIKIINLVFLFLTLIIAMIKLKKNYNKIIFKNEIILISILIIVEILLAKIYSNQSIFNGMNVGIFLLRYLFYFYIFYVMVKEKKAEKVVNSLISISTIISILYIVQAILYPKIIIFNMIYFQRDGRTRFYTGITFIILSMFLALERYSKTNKKRYIVSSFIMLFEIMFVGQTRNIIIVLSIMVLINLNKVFKLSKKNFAIMLIILPIIIVLVRLNYFIDMFNSVINEITTRTGSAGFRVNEIKYYFNGFLERPMLGNGLYYDGIVESAQILGRQFKYFQNDVGIIGSLFSFGIVGIGIFLSLIWKIRVYSEKLLKINKKINLASNMLIQFIILSVFFMFYMDNGISIVYIVIIICYLEYDYNIFSR